MSWIKSTALAALALSLVCTSGAHAKASVGSDMTTAMRSALRLRSEGSMRSERQVIEELAALGQDAIPIFFAAFVGENLDALVGEDSSSLWCSPDEIGDLAYAALCAQNPKTVLGYVKGRLDESSPIELRLSGVRILGGLGSASGMEYLLELTEGFGPLALRYRSVRTPVERSLVGMLRADARSWSELRERLGELDQAAMPIVIQAISESDRPQGVELLGMLMGRSVETDMVVMEHIAELSDRFSWRVDTPLWLVRRYLEHQDPQLRRSAAIALGKMQDLDSVTGLLKLLEDEHPGVRRASQWSLRTMSKTELPVDVESWRHWFEDQRSWWEHQRERLQGQLDGPDPGQALAAVRELSQRPLLRHEVVDVLVSGLRHPSVEVAIATCNALRKIESCQAVPALVDALYSDDDELGAAAWVTLKLLTGRDLPLDRASWEAFVQG